MTRILPSLAGEFNLPTFWKDIFGASLDVGDF